MMNLYIGIDPGASGGLAVVDANGKLFATTNMPETERDVFDRLSYWAKTELFKSFAIIEKVGGYVGGGDTVGKGGGSANGSAMFKFGMSYGGLRMALIALEIPFQEFAPVSWQPSMGVRPIKGESKKDHKNRLKAMAQQLFPSEKITLATADAILLAEMARRVYSPKS